MFKRIAGALSASFLLCSASAQQVGLNDFNLKLYGFVRTDYYVDTYKGNDVAHENFYLVPWYTGQDANGEDLNEQTSANLTALASRLGAKIQGPELLGAQTAAVLEFDFGGITKTEPTLFRIRHAYVAFSWDQSKLTVGQTWHPFFGGGVFPAVGAFNTGAPFQAFNRSPLVRYDYKLGKLTVGAAAIYENQYASKSLDSGSYSTANQAKRNGVLPELTLTAEYKANGLTLGAGAEWKRIKPRMLTEGSLGTYKADAYLNSHAVMGYVKYQHEKLSVTAKTFYGQNMTHLCILGGYAVATKNESTGAETYTNFNTSSSLLNVVYGKKWQVGMFAAYLKNLGTSDAVYDNNGAAITAGLLPAIQEAARASVHVALNVDKLRFVAECEITTADYGVDGLDFADGTYSDTHRATNQRVSLSMVYAF
ncbi:hypothetical protein [Mangrovibacterium marinum]|uniref:OmpL-like beta-barrel porin-2 n=1 Tax=Mangrovibacterium marinum TaxID=1639118 RepID=A0A2T5C5H4_9BACT|nr:hypothetical protein [Mangrovibacterium marinum]PTN10155.1 hypothetical protein C8N47_102140 [Mangrovibacterium marinum]